MDDFERFRVEFDLGVTEACTEIGISKSLYYALRDGKTPLTEKTVNKLSEARERRVNPPQSLRMSPRPQSSGSLFGEGPSPSYGSKPSPAKRKITKTEAEVLFREVELRLDLLRQAYFEFQEEEEEGSDD